MKFQLSPAFNERYDALSKEAQKRADKSLRLFANNARHPSLKFKKVHQSDPIYSIRAGLDYRLVGRKEQDCMVWFWVGKHDKYERLLANM